MAAASLALRVTNVVTVALTATFVPLASWRERRGAGGDWKLACQTCLLMRSGASTSTFEKLSRKSLK